MYCPKCRQNILESDTFCQSCGHDLRQSGIPRAVPVETDLTSYSQTDSKAVASLVLGVLSVTVLSVLAGVPAIILGHVSRRANKQNPPRLKGQGLALAGLIMGYVSIGLLGILMVVFLRGSKAGPNAGPNATDVAQVGGDSISAREFETAYRNYAQRMKGQVDTETLHTLHFERQIMDALVTRHVITEEAKRLKLNVKPAEVEQKILENPIFLENGAFIGAARYQAILKQNNLSIQEFESAVASELLSDKLKTLITTNVSVSDKDVEEESRRRNQRVRLDYFVIDPSRLGDRVAISENDERNYYETNKGNYSIPEKRKAKYLFFDTLKLRSEAKVTEDELRQYYEQHKIEYTRPERLTAQHILFRTQGKAAEEVEKIKDRARGVLKRARQGENFGSLARQFSEDSTAGSGGDLGYFSRGQMVPEFESAAFSLGVGSISDLVQTQFGIHIIKVNGKQPAQERPFAEIKEAIRPIVETRKAEQRASDLAQQSAVDLVNNKNLDAVAAKYKTQVKETPLVEQSGAILELGNANELERKMFTMAKGEIGTAIQVDRGYVVPQLIDIAPSHPASFEEARPKLAAEVRTQKAKDLVAAKTKQIAALKSGKELVAAAKANGAVTKTSDLLARGASLPDFGPIGEGEEQMFRLSPGEAGNPVTVAGKTLAFVVKERQEVKPAQMEKFLEMVRTELLLQRREQYFSKYIEDVRKKMESGKKIKINDSLVTQIAQGVF